MRVKFILLVLIVVAKTIPLLGQSNRAWLKNIADFRSYVLTSEEQNLLFLDSLYEHWEPIIHLETFDKIDTLYNIAYAHRIGYFNKDKLHQLSALIKHGYRETEIERTLIRKIDNCLNILSIMYEGFIDYEIPYTFSADSSFGKAMDFFDFKEGELVADIGAGIGTYVWVLSQLFPQSSFIVTELFQGPDTYLQNRFLEMKNVEFKRAKKKHTNLEGRGINRILIQSTFHHFKEKDLMLQSIKKSLSSDGIIILKEATYDLAGHQYCEKSMRLEDIKWYWDKNGFQLLDEMTIRKTTYLKFSPQ